MTDIANQAFGRLTSIPRKLKVLPEEARTPQGMIDISRGKKKPKHSSLFGDSLYRQGSSFATMR
jgi:hypothetical protein